MQKSQISQILEELCQKHNVPIELIRQMLEEERDVRHLKIRTGTKDRLRQIIEKSIGVQE